MGWTPKMVALDIDGTLVDEAGRLPHDVRQAVDSVVAADVPVVLSTGRGWHGTRIVFDELGLPPGWVVSANGAVVAEYPPLRVRSIRRFHPGEAIDKVHQFAPGALIAVDEGAGWRASAEFPPGELTGPVTYEAPEALGSRPVTRIVVRDPNGDHRAFHELTTLIGLRDVSYFVGWDCWLDIAPPDVDKAAGLTTVAEQLGVDRSDVLALGDGRNDIGMLSWAGRGVALADSPAEVVSAADDVCPPFDEGGIVPELARWFPSLSLRPAS